MEPGMYGNGACARNVNEQGHTYGNVTACPKCGALAVHAANYCHKCGAQIGVSPSLEDVALMQTASHLARMTEAISSHRAAHFKDAVTSQPCSSQDKTSSNLPLSVVWQNVSAVSRAGALSGREDPAPVTKPLVSAGRNVAFLAIDVVLFALVSLVPWVGSYYTSQGGSVSIPSLVVEGFKLLSQLSQYSSYASQLGVDSTYKNAVVLVFLVALIAGTGWLVVAKSLYDDAKSDFEGKPAAGDGARGVAVLAGLVQVIVWIGVAVVQSSLRSQYLDLSGFGSGTLQTTGWVWVSFAAGIAASRFRKGVPDACKA